MRWLATALLLTAALGGVAQAATLRVAQPVERACSARLLGAHTPGAARARHVPGAAGLVTVRLRSAGGDWDLAVFDARSRRRLDASASFGPRETVAVPAARGRALIAQACRRSGRARRAGIAFAETPLPDRSGPVEPVQMLRVRLPGPRDRARLEALGLDVTHSEGPGWADVVTYTGAERRQLAAAGLGYTVRIADMVAADRRALASAASSAALPSGRTAYRTYAEYGEDLKALAAASPGLVRPLEIGRSIEDRPIEGIEIASGVARTDDGRPTLVVMGLHHAREWPAGEMPMEFATDLVKRHPADARVKALLDAVRIIVLPVINPDGFAVSRGAGSMSGDDDPFTSLPQSLTSTGAYKRKNCRAPDPATQALPCAARPPGAGVDLNRNYGAYYGGDGASPDPTSETYRGTGPYSEPESQAVHGLSQTRNIVLVITHHTFTNAGVWLRQPGFCFEDPCDGGDVVPDEAGMKALGDSMAEASGWTSQLGWAIGEITGATEDWNYFATGAYGYTPEQRGQNFHPSFDTAVVAEWPGVGEALLRAGELARDRAHHSVIAGSAPAGRVLRLTKRFVTPTLIEGLGVDDALNLTMTVPAGGAYSWDVNPSTRPLAIAPEAYRMTCETPAGEVLETRDVTVARGQVATVDLGCGGAAAGGSQPGAGGSSGAGIPAGTLRLRLAATTLRLTAFLRRPRVTLRVLGGSLRRARLTLLDSRGRTVGAGRAATLRARATVKLRLRRAPRRGRHRLRVTGRDPSGRSVRATLPLRLR